MCAGFWLVDRNLKGGQTQWKQYKSMQLTLLWLHAWVLTTKPFKFTTQPCSTQCTKHQSTWFWKVHNPVKLDVCSSEWDDTCCETYPWDTVDHNRKFSEIKCSKMLKLVHNLRCRSNFTKRALLLDSSCQNSPKRPCFTKVGDFTGDFINK